jgi:hypothetical protein
MAMLNVTERATAEVIATMSSVPEKKTSSVKIKATLERSNVNQIQIQVINIFFKYNF